MDIYSRARGGGGGGDNQNEGVCLEILGSLRRCLTQQADVRLFLYEVHSTTHVFIYHCNHLFTCLSININIYLHVLSIY